MAKAPGGVGVGALSYKAPKALWPAEAVTDGTMADTEAVQRATELIDQRLAEEEENEKLRGTTHGRKLPMDKLVLEDEKKHGAQSPALQKVKGQERVRKTSLDLRREIIDVGGIQNLIELRKKRKQKKREALAAPQEPPPEPEEITGPVDGETFLKAAVEGKMKVIEKFLADGGSADTCDQFRRTALHRASLEGHMEILEKLLESGATVDFQDRLDCTAMHWACRGGHLEVVKLLQNRGADSNVRDKALRDHRLETGAGRADEKGGEVIHYLGGSGTTPKMQDLFIHAILHHPSICLSVHPSIHSSIHSLIHSFTYLFIHNFSSFVPLYVTLNK
nr:ankyrin repeat domain-containing protein 2 isoform X2 [Equus caballus]